MLDMNHPDPSLPVLNPDHVLRTLGGSMEDYLEVAAVFLEELPNMSAEVASLAHLPMARTIAALHELANSFGVVGALRGAHFARATEDRLRQALPVDVGTVSDWLAQELLAVQQALSELS